jgi:hypothetical protein
VQLIAQRFQAKYNQDLRKVTPSSPRLRDPPQVLQEYTGSYYRQAMLAYLEGLQPLGSIEAEMALYLTPPGGEAQEGRIEFLAQALNNAKVGLPAAVSALVRPIGIHRLAGRRSLEESHQRDRDRRAPCSGLSLSPHQEPTQKNRCDLQVGCGLSSASFPPFLPLREKYGKSLAEYVESAVGGNLRKFLRYCQVPPFPSLLVTAVSRWKSPNSTSWC